MIIIFIFLLLYLKITFFLGQLAPLCSKYAPFRKKRCFCPFLAPFKKTVFFATFGVFKLLGQNHRVEALVGGKSYLES